MGKIVAVVNQRGGTGKTVRFPESAVSAQPIFKYDPRNPASRAYIQLAKEIDTHG
jgi:cellulose biosynthesis protein BcsQ